MGLALMLPVFLLCKNSMSFLYISNKGLSETLYYYAQRRLYSQIPPGSNPHTHIILTEGLLSEKTDEDGELLHYPLPNKDFTYINRLWRNKVLLLLRNMKMIDEQEMEEYKQQYPYGFHVDVRFRATWEPEEREKLAQYIIRQPIGNSRIDRYDREKGEVALSRLKNPQKSFEKS